ncbi:MAG TPA: hypothetical protein VF713_09810 [Thermoanaerobaculia bacterium]
MVQSTYNDPALTERLAAAPNGMGTGNVIRIDPLMVSEDFGRFSLDCKIPITMLNLGAVYPAKIAGGQRMPPELATAILRPALTTTTNQSPTQEQSSKDDRLEVRFVPLSFCAPNQVY